jgi:hypothetical protein
VWKPGIEIAIGIPRVILHVVHDARQGVRPARQNYIYFLPRPPSPSRRRSNTVRPGRGEQQACLHRGKRFVQTWQSDRVRVFRSASFLKPTVYICLFIGCGVVGTHGVHQLTPWLDRADIYAFLSNQARSTFEKTAATGSLGNVRKWVLIFSSGTKKTVFFYSAPHMNQNEAYNWWLYQSQVVPVLSMVVHISL